MITNFLTEESYHVWDNSNELFYAGYTRRFNSNGDIVSSENFDIDESQNSKFEYDELSRLMKEIILIRKHNEPGQELRKEYVYHDHGYTILTYEARIIDNYATCGKFTDGLVPFDALGEDFPRDTNRLIVIEDLIVDKFGKIISSRKNNLINHSITLDEYAYDHNTRMISSFSLSNNNKTLERLIIQKCNNDGEIVSEHNSVFLDGAEQIGSSCQYLKDGYDQTKIKITKYADGEESEEKYDYHGNIIEKRSNRSERLIYINTYNNSKQIESVIEILVTNEYHYLSSKKFYKYQ